MLMIGDYDFWRICNYFLSSFVMRLKEILRALHYFFFFFRMPIVKILSKRRRKRDDFSEFGDDDFFEGVDFQIQKSDPSIQYYPSPYCNLVESKPQSNFLVENFININCFLLSRFWISVFRTFCIRIVGCEWRLFRYFRKRNLATYPRKNIT